MQPIGAPVTLAMSPCASGIVEPWLARQPNAPAAHGMSRTGPNASCRVDRQFARSGSAKPTPPKPEARPAARRLRSVMTRTRPSSVPSRWGSTVGSNGGGWNAPATAEAAAPRFWAAPATSPIGTTPLSVPRPGVAAEKASANAADAAAETFAVALATSTSAPVPGTAATCEATDATPSATAPAAWATGAVTGAASASTDATAPVAASVVPESRSCVAPVADWLPSSALPAAVVAASAGGRTGVRGRSGDRVRGRSYRLDGVGRAGKGVGAGGDDGIGRGLHGIGDRLDGVGRAGERVGAGGDDGIGRGLHGVGDRLDGVGRAGERVGAGGDDGIGRGLHGIGDRLDGVGRAGERVGAGGDERVGRGLHGIG